MHMPKLNNEFILEPLSWENLDETIAMANAIFPYNRSATRGPEYSYRMHLKDPAYRGEARYRRIGYSEFYLVRESHTGQPAGVIGYLVYYGKQGWPTAWLRWFGVSPDFRGRGLGTLTLKWVEKRLLKKGFTSIKLFGSSRRCERSAQAMYESRGYRVFRTNYTRDAPRRVFIRRKML